MYSIWNKVVFANTHEKKDTLELGSLPVSLLMAQNLS